MYMFYEGQTRQWPKEKQRKGQITMYKTLHRKLKIEQHEPHKNRRVNAGAQEVSKQFIWI
jgi:hypothetical protein